MAIHPGDLNRALELYQELQRIDGTTGSALYAQGTPYAVDQAATARRSAVVAQLTAWAVGPLPKAPS